MFNCSKAISKQNKSSNWSCTKFVLTSPNTKINYGRLLRAMQIQKPILLEGSPGVGKSSIVGSVASLCGHNLVRINLSEHTDIADLFGSDLPNADFKSEGAVSFTWCDGILVKAMKNGDWVLLDELNLAPQAVLEGLNSCFDHRKSVFVPEIGLSIECSDSFRIFCTQNPMKEGGGRKGLPKSFLSRMIRVFMKPILEDDMVKIMAEMYHDNTLSSQIYNMVYFVQKLHSKIVKIGDFGKLGSPWEFNIRDVMRWCELVGLTLDQYMDFEVVDSIDYDFLLQNILVKTCDLLFVERMRTTEDKNEIKNVT